MDPRPHATIRVTRAPVLKPRLAMRQSRGTAWVQPAFPERCFQALFASHEVVFTALAFDCNPTHFVTPQAIPVAHNAFAPQRFVSNCCAPCSASDGSPSDNTATAHSRCKVTPPFRIDPSKGFPVRAALPGPRAFFLCAIRAPASSPSSPRLADPSFGRTIPRDTRSYKAKSTPRRLQR